LAHGESILDKLLQCPHRFFLADTHLALCEGGTVARSSDFGNHGRGFCFCLSVDFIPQLLKGLPQSVNVRAECTNHLLLPIAKAFGVKREANGKLDTAGNGLPSTATNSETSDRKVKYDPLLQLMATSPKETDFEFTWPSVAGQGQFTGFKQVPQPIDVGTMSEDNPIASPATVVPAWEIDPASSTIPTAVLHSKTSHIQLEPHPRTSFLC
jgi:hypothetical protein